MTMNFAKTMIVMLALVACTFAAAPAQLLFTGNGAAIDGNLTVNISTTANETGQFYTHTWDAVLGGNWSVTLGQENDLNLTQNEYYWLAYSINDTPQQFTNNTGDTSYWYKFQSPVGETVVSGTLFNNWTASQIGALVGNWSGNISNYYLNSEVYNKTEAAALFNNLSTLDIATLVGNWSADKGSYYLNSEVYNKTEVIQLISNTSINGSVIVALVGNWSDDKGSYYLNSEVYNKTEAATLFNNLSTSDIASLVGNWTDDKGSYYLNSEVYNKTEAATLFNNLSSTSIVSLVGNWSADKADYYNNTEVYNQTQTASLFNNWTTEQIVDLVGNWSGNISNYYLNTEVYNMSETATLFNNLSSSDIASLVGNWSADKGDYYLNSEVYNMTETAALFNNLSTSDIVSLVGNWSADKASYATITQLTGLNVSLQANISSLNITKIQNGSSANLSNIYSVGNITANSYLMGQPLTGMLGSGLIRSIDLTSSYSSDINVTCSGLTCTYNNFTVRIMQGNAAQIATYCDMPNGSVVVPDNTFATYYVSATNSTNCALVQTTYDSWFTSIMQTGGKWDAFYVLSQNGVAEVIDSISLEQRRMMKQRILNYYTQQSKVISGFGIQASGAISGGFNITAGKTVFGMDVVNVNTHIVNATAANHIEMVGHNSSTTWQFNDDRTLNITHCDNGTAVNTCTGNNYRRYYIFTVGYDGGLGSSELHGLYARESLSYNTLAACLDTTTNPLIYTMPEQYTGATVMLYAYCSQRTATTWSTSSLIDMRTVKTGSATGGTDISGLVPYSGATQSVDLGSYNITADYSNAKVNASYIQNAPWLTTTPYQNSAAGWVNTSTQTSTSLLVNLTATGTVTGYSNGCTTVANATGLFFIC